MLHSGAAAVYTVEGKYTARPEVDGFPQTELAVPVKLLDAAFSEVMVTVLTRLELAKKAGAHASFRAHVQTLQQEQERQASEYEKALARIETEIRNAEMAQEVSKNLGDRPGYEAATKQVVQLRRDKAAIEARAKDAGKEAGELAECHNLLECACQQWGSMSLEKRKRLDRLLGTDANVIELSQHYLHKDLK